MTTPSFRFTLRMMLAIFVLAAIPFCVFGYYARWIRQRHDAMDPTTSSTNFFHDGGKSPVRRPFPLGLRLLGEGQISDIYVVTDDANKPTRLRQLFPEAIIHWEDHYLWNNAYYWETRLRKAR